MTLVVIGPVTEDLVIIGDDESSHVGGATYFQSFVLEEFYDDYMVIINCADESLANEFPNPSKVRVIRKDDTHFFINEYPNADDRDIRNQLSNFADIPILKSDLENILPENVDAFVLNPLNRHDFPVETVEYLKGFDVPVYMSIQGFLRVSGKRANNNYAIELECFEDLNGILDGVAAIFLDEAEAAMVGMDFDVDEMVITAGSHGSRIVSDDEIKIDAVKCVNVVDTTGCGDTYMAAYVSQRLMSKSRKEAGNFASLIASEKLASFGPFNREK